MSNFTLEWKRKHTSLCSGPDGIEKYRINCQGDFSNPPFCSGIGHAALPGFTVAFIDSVYGFILFLTFFYIMRNVYSNNIEAIRGMPSKNLLRFSSHIKIVHATLLWAVAWGIYCVFSPGHADEIECKYRIWTDLEHAFVTGGIRAASQALEVFTLVHLIVDSLGTVELLAFRWATVTFVVIFVSNVGVLMAHSTGRNAGNGCNAWETDWGNIVTKLLATVTRLEVYFLFFKAVFFSAIYGCLLVYSIRHQLKLKRRALTYYSSFLLVVSLLRLVSFGLFQPWIHQDCRKPWHAPTTAPSTAPTGAYVALSQEYGADGSVAHDDCSWKQDQANGFDNLVADRGICFYQLSMLLYFGAFGFATYIALVCESRYWFSQLSNLSPGAGSRDPLVYTFDDPGSTTPLLGPNTTGAHAVAQEMQAAQGRLHSNEYSTDLSDCIIPTIELKKMRNQPPPLEGGNAAVEKYIYRQQLVAVKRLLPHKMGSREKLQELHHEVAVLKMLRHPHIVDFKGVWFDPPNLGIVMEYCRMDLYDALQEERRSSPERRFRDLRSLRVARDIAAGLNYLHTRSIPLVHRDVKSLNVLLTRDMRAKIADFGDSAMQAVQSKLQGSELNRASFHTKNRHGTAAWMAPEAMTLEDRLTSAVDVFSFGVVMWECITFKEPTLYLCFQGPYDGEGSTPRSSQSGGRAGKAGKAGKAKAKGPAGEWSAYAPAEEHGGGVGGGGGGSGGSSSSGGGSSSSSSGGSSGGSSKEGGSSSAVKRVDPAPAGESNTGGAKSGSNTGGSESGKSSASSTSAGSSETRNASINSSSTEFHAHTDTPACTPPLLRTPRPPQPGWCSRRRWWAAVTGPTVQWRQALQRACGRASDRDEIRHQDGAPAATAG